MSYLVMECHPAYVVVLDSQGRFLKAANLGYEIGQELEEIIALKEPARARQFSALGALAACLCLMVLGSWQMLRPQGTVRMQINPDVMMWVNRLNYVVKLEGVNEDGRVLAEGVETFGKKVDVLSDELADRAMALGYLEEGGQITLTVESDNEKWKTATQELLVLELEVHLPQTVQIVAAPSAHSSDAPPPEQTVIIPADPDNWDDGDWDEDDDEDDDFDDQDGNDGQDDDSDDRDEDNDQDDGSDDEDDDSDRQDDDWEAPDDDEDE